FAVQYYYESAYRCILGSELAQRRVTDESSDERDELRRSRRTGHEGEQKACVGSHDRGGGLCESVIGGVYRDGVEWRWRGRCFGRLDHGAAGGCHARPVVCKRSAGGSARGWVRGEVSEH